MLDVGFRCKFAFERFHGCYFGFVKWELNNSKKILQLSREKSILVQSIIQLVLIRNGVTTFSVISHKKFEMDIFDIVRKRLSVITQSVLSFYAAFSTKIKYCSSFKFLLSYI